MENDAGDFELVNEMGAAFGSRLFLGMILYCRDFIESGLEIQVAGYSLQVSDGRKAYWLEERLKVEAQSKLYLALTIEVIAVAVQRMAKSCRVGFGPIQEG